LYTAEQAAVATIPKEYPAGSIHSSLGWQGQFARVSRWLDRLMSVRSPKDAEDYLYAFFQNCYHLQDWVLTVHSQTDVDSFVKGSLPLRICRDVANLTKHFVLQRTPGQGHELSVLREYAGPGEGWFEGDTRLVIVTNYKNDGIVLDAREVARECLRLWCTFVPDCDMVRDVQNHFRFSEVDFPQVLSKAEAMTKWAREVTTRE
jgi:hypothetical protein